MSADPLPFALDARVDVAAETTTDARDIESGRSAREGEGGGEGGGGGADEKDAGWLDDDDPTFFVIGFKVCIEETDHWMNRLATWGTGRAVHDANIDFSGQISHAEILMRDEDPGGEWIRYSILKRKGVRGRDEVTGKPVIRWVPATVHGIVTTPQAVKNYRFYRIDTTKRNARRAREFLEREKIKESGFNFWGYALNFVFPFKIGKNNVREASEEKKNSWFCTELVVCAMQRAEVHRAMALKACAVSPNQLHAFVEKFQVGKHVVSTTFLAA